MSDNIQPPENPSSVSVVSSSSAFVPVVNPSSAFVPVVNSSSTVVPVSDIFERVRAKEEARLQKDAAEYFGSQLIRNFICYKMTRPIQKAIHRVKRTPYMVHHQMFMRQQREQERRRVSLSRPLPRLLEERVSWCLDPSLEYLQHWREHIDAKTISLVDRVTERSIVSSDCNDSCVICMSNYKARDEVRNLQCSHRFHRRCIDEWLVNLLSCPVCRKDLDLTKLATMRNCNTL